MNDHSPISFLPYTPDDRPRKAGDALFSPGGATIYRGLNLPPLRLGNHKVEPIHWPTMDSAPKDGTRILIYDSIRDVVVSGIWHNEPTIDTPNAYEPGWSFWAADNDTLVWEHDDLPHMRWHPMP